MWWSSSDFSRSSFSSSGFKQLVGKRVQLLLNLDKCLAFLACSCSDASFATKLRGFVTERTLTPCSGLQLLSSRFVRLIYKCQYKAPNFHSIHYFGPLKKKNESENYQREFYIVLLTQLVGTFHIHKSKIYVIFGPYKYKSRKFL